MLRGLPSGGGVIVQAPVAARKKERKRMMAAYNTSRMAWFSGVLYDLNANGRPIKRVFGALEIPKPDKKAEGVSQRVLDRNQEEESRLAAARQMARKKEKKEAIRYSELSRLVTHPNYCPNCDTLLTYKWADTVDSGQIELRYCRICGEYFR